MDGPYESVGTESILPRDAESGFVRSFEIEEPHEEPKAKWYHASFHSVCGVVGAGVLGLPFAFSYLGWVGGCIDLTAFLIFAVYTSDLLARLHECGAPGRRLNTYGEIADAALGRRWANVLIRPSQYALLVGLCITYSVTAGQSLKGFVSSDCQGSECQDGIAKWIALFGAVQLLLSLVRDIHSLWFVSLIGSVMSIGYVVIAAVVASIDAATGKGREAAPRTETKARVIFGTFNALGTIAFTFGGQAILPEIQATLTPVAGTALTLVPMRISLCVSFVIVFLAYYAVSISGYIAYGSSVSSDVLLNIQTSHAVRDAANMMVVFHVAAAFQVFAQPIFALVERAIGRTIAPQKIGFAQRTVMRFVYVVFCTLIAIVFPFFEEMMGIISSIGLIPMSFVFPSLFWVVSQRPGGFVLAFNLLIILSCTAVAALSLVGSVRNIIVNLSH